MNLLYAFSLASLMGCGVFLFLSRHVIRMILGIALMSAAINLIIFVSGRVGSMTPPVIEDGARMLGPDAANSLPQALILTAIVIGFSLVAFAVALALQAYRSLGSIDNSELDAAEKLGSPFDRTGSGNG